jgi:hypothetical protein
LDSLLGLYRITIRSRKWYKRIFFHLIDLCVVNAWLLWRRTNEVYMPLYEFKLAVSEDYRKAGKCIVRKRGRPSATSSPSCRTPPVSRANTPTTPTGRPLDSPLSKKPRKKPARNQELPLNSVRSDMLCHIPVHEKTRLLCQNNCGYRSYLKCEKCNVYLCLNEKRNCFKEFHL